MANKTSPLLPSTDELLRQLGERLRVARLRRHLSAKQVAERAGMSPMTLRSLERGGAGVTIGAYLAVMQVLGIESDINLLAKADPVGRELQDANLSAHRKSDRTMPARPLEPSGKRNKEFNTLIKPSQDVQDWIKQSDFATSVALAELIAPPPSSAKRRG